MIAGLFFMTDLQDEGNGAKRIDRYHLSYSGWLLWDDNTHRIR